jgi:hypothetical protein
VVTNNNEDFDITDDRRLRQATRVETGYADSRLEQHTLDGLIDSAKRVLALKAGVTDFYADRGISTALLGITCAKAKGHVENSPVKVTNVAGQDVTFRTTDGSSLQIAEYEEMTQLGLSETALTDDAVHNIRFTNDYLSDNSSL